MYFCLVLFTPVTGGPDRWIPGLIVITETASWDEKRPGKRSFSSQIAALLESTSNVKDYPRSTV